MTGPESSECHGESQGPVLVMHEKYSAPSWKLQATPEAALGR